MDSRIMQYSADVAQNEITELKTALMYLLEVVDTPLVRQRLGNAFPVTTVAHAKVVLNRS